jgi:hypothetical protein
MPIGPKSFYVWYGQDDMASQTLECNEKRYLKGHLHHSKFPSEQN